MEIKEACYSSRELGECYQLDEQMMKASWPIHHWLDLANRTKEYQLRILEDSETIGFSLWKVDVIDHFAHLLKIVIRSDYQGKGLGRGLLQSDMELFQQWGVYKYYLEVAENNDTALQLYLSDGFKQVNKVRHFYSDGSDALILYKEV